MIIINKWNGLYIKKIEHKEKYIRLKVSLQNNNDLDFI